MVVRLLALLFPLMLLNSCGEPQQQNSEDTPQETPVTVERYLNKEYAYSVDIKSDWEQKVSSGDGFMNILWGMPPVKSKYSKKLVAPHFGVEASKNWESLDEAILNSKTELENASYAFDWDEENKSAVFQFGDPNRQLKGKCCFLEKNGIVYRLTFSANKDSYDRYISDFEQFCTSFRME